MRILLVHPEDSPRRGPWSRQRWDLLIDLGQSTRFSQEDWTKHYGCPVLSAASFRRGAADARIVKQAFSEGWGYIVDEDGIDHWELISINVIHEAATILALERLIREMPKSGELWCTRAEWPANIIPLLLNQPVRTIGQGGIAQAATAAKHYAEVLRRFSAPQIKEIFLDKYDPGYRWRSRFSRRPARCPDPVVLIPSAYVNVSRVAAAYARLLPDQAFLMVATRRSAHQFSAAANVHSRNLAEYATADVSSGELSSLAQRWQKLRSHLQSSEILRPVFQSGGLDSFGDWLKDGIHAREAWREVLDREPVCGVLRGDDSNRYTRLPVLLAAKRNIATADFHHGALDGHYLLKNLPSDVYLAKSEMERDYLLRICGLPEEKVVIAPPAGATVASPTTSLATGRSIVLFSEPYEIAGLRADEVYAELLPPLWKLARETDHSLTVKLHPFESRSQRERLLRQTLPSDAARQVRIVDGPLTGELLAQAWCGITVESTVVMECMRQGVCCFLCGWLTMSPYEYVRQYIRFGVGEFLENAGQIGLIPQLVARFENRATKVKSSDPADPAILRQWLTSRDRESCGVRSAS